MITSELIKPRSIVVVGGSDDIHKPGGAALRNLIRSGFTGPLYVVNPKKEVVQGIVSYPSVDDLPQVDMAILAIPAAFCPSAVESLCRNKETKAVIIFSAGFSEENHEGAILEQKIKDTVNRYGASLIGPNCVGVMNHYYTGVFTSPVPRFDESGVDLISGSGATALYIIDAAMQLGIPFCNVFSVGNSAQLGVEDILQWMDETYQAGISSPVKLLYIESINNPEKLLRHASSLIRKGARIAAVKSGYSAAGGRAASSHTGAMATPEKAVSALFKKAGIVRCYGRSELLYVAAILLKGLPKGKNMCIITHAGGPAVMLTDALSTHNINVPHLDESRTQALLDKLFAGSSVGNPIDFLATGTAKQLDDIIEFVENSCPEVDAMTVIFGSPGLNSVFDVYDVLDQKLKTCKKPIYPVFPSTNDVQEEIKSFMSKGRLFFPDEVLFGEAFAKVMNTPAPSDACELPPIDKGVIRQIVDRAQDGFLNPEDVFTLLDASGINITCQKTASTVEDAVKASASVGFPLVMKTVGPIHKSDVGGVRLNIKDEQSVAKEFESMMRIKGTTGVLLQTQVSGTELFIGANRNGSFGHLILCGLGGIFVEVWKDISSSLSPVSKTEAQQMIESLRGYKLLEGIRGQEGVNIPLFQDAIRRVSALCEIAPEIAEMDINPLMGTEKQIMAVDARIRIEHLK